MSAEYEFAILALNVNRNLGYAVTAGGTLLTYDVLTSLEKEIVYVWAAPWNFGTTIYLLNRYLPFVDTFVAVTAYSSFNSPKDCERGSVVAAVFVIVGTIISEVILMVRTYAVWGRKRSVLVGLIILGVITIASVVISASLEIASWTYGLSPFPEIHACFLTGASKIIYVSYATLIICETCLVILTMIKGVQHIRQTRSIWIRKMYQDGLLFYLYTLLASGVNIVIPLIAPPGYENIVAVPQRVLHSVFCTRVLLLLFEQRQRDRTSRTIELTCISRGISRES